MLLAPRRMRALVVPNAPRKHRSRILGESWVKFLIRAFLVLRQAIVFLELYKYTVCLSEDSNIRGIVARSVLALRPPRVHAKERRRR